MREDLALCNAGRGDGDPSAGCPQLCTGCDSFEEPRRRLREEVGETFPSPSCQPLRLAQSKSLPLSTDESRGEDRAGLGSVSAGLAVGFFQSALRTALSLPHSRADSRRSAIFGPGLFLPWWLRLHLFHHLFYICNEPLSPPAPASACERSRLPALRSLHGERLCSLAGGPQAGSGRASGPASPLAPAHREPGQPDSLHTVCRRAQH